MFDQNSDIDIAIEGLENGSSFFKVWDTKENLIDNKTDLLELKKKYFQQLILEEGLKIK